MDTLPKSSMYRNLALLILFERPPSLNKIQIPHPHHPLPTNNEMIIFNTGKELWFVTIYVLVRMSTKNGYLVVPVVASVGEI